MAVGLHHFERRVSVGKAADVVARNLAVEEVCRSRCRARGASPKGDRWTYLRTIQTLVSEPDPRSGGPRIRSGGVAFVDIEDCAYDGAGNYVVILHGHALVTRLELRTNGLHIISLAE